MLYLQPMTHVPRYVPARTNEGWPIVGLITALTIALIIGVVMIHKKTYTHPTNPVSPGGSAPAATAH